MKSSIDIFASDKTFKNFLQSLNARGLKQAYIFNSNDKLKNQTACKIISMIANCESESKPCFACSSCIKILNETSLDYFVYPKDKAIVVDDIKEIIDTCYVMPNENKYKIYVLNDFEKANISSQNKFLKTLENPPSNVIFLINTNNLDMVLDTIKSRVQIINLPSFDNDELEKMIKDNSLTFSQEALENCEGELGNYLKLIESPFEEILNFCFELLLNLNSSSEILNYSTKIIKDKANLENYFIALTSIFKDALTFKFNKKLVKNKSKIDKIEEISQKFSQKAINEILNNLIESNKELNFNTNEMLIIDTILINILEERYKWK